MFTGNGVCFSGNRSLFVVFLFRKSELFLKIEVSSFTEIGVVFENKGLFLKVIGVSVLKIKLGCSFCATCGPSNWRL